MTATKRSVGSSIFGIGSSISGCAMKLEGFVSISSDLHVTALLLGNSLQHRARFEDEGGKSNAAEVCAGSQLADDMRKDCTEESVMVLQGSLRLPYHFPGRRLPRSRRFRWCRQVWNRRWRSDCLIFYVSMAHSRLLLFGLQVRTDERMPPVAVTEHHAGEWVVGAKVVRERTGARCSV